jgi:hypothetical protein
MHQTMILKIWLTPPFAVARLGSSDTPLECFYWGPNDGRPRGTGKTTILPGETLVVADDGTVSSAVPTMVVFKDAQGFRPVCPFYELHGRWETDTTVHEGPLTPAVLGLFGLDASKLRWTVRVGNLKAFHMTQADESRIEAAVAIRGDDVAPKPLAGESPSGAENPLVPAGKSIPLGSVRLTRPNAAFPEFRLRFTPAKGRFYGPPDLKSRWINPATKAGVAIPDENLFLNATSAWVGFKITDDERTVPERLYAGEGDLAHGRASYGVVDDVCDGIMSVSIDGLDVPPAHARVTVSPPDYAPDRRHPVTLADGFKDRVGRDDLLDPAYVANLDATSREVLDLMERAYETMGLTNVDIYNNRVNTQENPAIAFDRGIPFKATEHVAFVPPPPTVGRTFPLTERGRLFHRRFTAIELFRDMLREHPNLIKEWIREPFDEDPFFTKRMPPVMRDSNGGPLHLTRRQYEVLTAWAQKVREAVEEGS